MANFTLSEFHLIFQNRCHEFYEFYRLKDGGGVVGLKLLFFPEQGPGPAKDSREGAQAQKTPPTASKQ